MERPSIGVLSWTGEELLEERDVTLDAALDHLRDARAAGRTAWLDVVGLHDTDLIERIGAELALHPLTLEDVASVGQRPKFEAYDDYLFLVARMLSLAEHGEEAAARLEDEQVSFVVARDVLVTFQERPGDVFDPVRDRLRAGKGRIRGRGPDYLAYALLDVLIDTGFGILEHYGDEAERLEDAIFADPRPPSLVRLQALRRDTLALRRAVWPLRDVLASLARDEGGLVTDPVRTFVRDALDHAVQAIDAVETLRELLGGLHDAYLSGVSHRMNEVMKVLTVIATIFIPLGFLVGVYGMNFVWMPELRLPWAYPVLWGIMISIAVSLAVYFRRRGWW
jgi:magnesium transporter